MQYCGLLSNQISRGFFLGLDKLEKRFGGERFNNPENEEKNRKLNENILKRLKQVAKMAL